MPIQAPPLSQSDAPQSQIEVFRLRITPPMAFELWSHSATGAIVRTQVLRDTKGFYLERGPHQGLEPRYTTIDALFEGVIAQSRLLNLALPQDPSAHPADADARARRKSELDAWVQAAPEQQHRHRQIAATRIRQVDAGQSSALYLSDLDTLTDLPALSTGLTELELGQSIWYRAWRDRSESREFMDRGCAALTRLPHLPDGLVRLTLDGCATLTDLPAELPASLRHLSLKGCHTLTRLPTLRPPGLIQLDIRDCTALTVLPDWATRLPLLSLSGSGTDLRPLETWYRRADRSEHDLSALKTAWMRFNHEAGHIPFIMLLERLGQLDARTEGRLVTPDAVVAIIDEVVASQEGRRPIFEAAHEATQNCEDRLLTTFNDMQALARASRLLRTGASEDAMLRLAAGILKTRLLDELVPAVMTRQWHEGRRIGNITDTGPNTTEALEMQLALRQHLAETLGLPFAARGLYTDHARLTASDLAFVTEQVRLAFADPQRLTDGLLAQPQWEQHLKTRLGDELAAGTRIFDQRMATLFDQRTSISDQEYQTQAHQIAAARSAAIQSALQQKTLMLLIQHRMERLQRRVADYIRDHPASGRVSALTAFASQLAEPLKTLHNAASQPLSEQVRLMRQTGLPSIQALMHSAAVAGKRQGPSYQAILLDLATLHAQQRLLTQSGTTDSGVPPRERLLPWDSVREYAAARFSTEGARAGGHVRHVPQALLLDTTPLPSRRGLCTGLALSWAFAPDPGLFDNIFSAAAAPADPQSLRFRQDLRQLQQQGIQDATSALKDITRWDQAVDHLATGSGERALLIHAGNHSVALAARGEGAQTRYAFFDPNAGAWSEIVAADPLKQALNRHFTDAARQYYQFSGALEVFSVKPPVAGSTSHQAWQRARLPLQTTVAPPDRKPGAIRNTPAPEATRARTRLTSGTGLRLYGVWRALSGAMDNMAQGRTAEMAIDLGGLTAEIAGEATERGAVRLGTFMQRPLTRTAAGATSIGQSVGRWLARGAGIAGNLLTLPFDLYSAINQFSQLNALQGHARADAIVRGSIATIGAASGLGLAIAAAAGASVTVLGPIGLAFGAAMLAAGQIHAALRQVQEVKQWLALSTGEELALGLRSFIGLGLDRATGLRTHQARQASRLQAEAAQLLTTRAGKAIAVLLYPSPHIDERAIDGRCDQDHAHDHLSLEQTDPTQYQSLALGDADPQSVIDDPIPATVRCPAHPAHVHQNRHGQETFIRATDDQLDFSAGALPAAHGDAQAVDNRRARETGPVIGTPSDDHFILNARVDHLTRQWRERRHGFVGGGGNDSLTVETGDDETDPPGYLIDLKSGRIALIQSSAAQPPIGTVAGIANLLAAENTARKTPTRHQFYGDDQANLLVGSGQDRLYGNGGDDTFSLSGSAFADGGDGNDLYLIDNLKAGDHLTLTEAGNDEHNRIYLAMNADQLHAARLTRRALDLHFASGAILTLQDLYEEREQVWTLRPGRWSLISQDGKGLSPDLPVTPGGDQNVVITVFEQPQALAEILTTPGVQTLARLQREHEQVVLFNFGDGNDTLRGDSARPNRFNLGSGNKSITGGARNDSFILNANPDFIASGIEDYDSASRHARAQRIGHYRYALDGGAGIDALSLDTPFASSAYLGYRVDLAGARIGLIARDGQYTMLGTVQDIENLIAADNQRAADTRHELLGDDQPNLLAGTGHDRLEGRGGNDVLRVAGQAHALGGDGDDRIQMSDSTFADGGAGLDTYLIDALKASDHMTIHDRGATGPNDSVIRLNFALSAIRDWQVRQNDLVLTMDSGGTLTIKDVYRSIGGQTTLSPSGLSFISRDGFILDPELPENRPAGDATHQFRIAATYFKPADLLYADDGQGIVLDLAQRTLAARQEAPTQWTRAPRETTLLDARYRLIADGSAHDDTLIGARATGAITLLRGRDGNDTLIAPGAGALMRGDEGADRYRIELNAPSLPQGEAWYLDNQASDGAHDTLEITTTLTRERFELTRVDDDLHLSVRPDDAEDENAPPASVVVLGYYAMAERRHLALELKSPDGSSTQRINASALEQWALRGETSRLAARLEQLITAMATDPARGAASAPLPSPPDARESNSRVLLAAGA